MDSYVAVTTVNEAVRPAGTDRIRRASSKREPRLHTASVTIGSAPWILPGTLTWLGDDIGRAAVVLVHGSGAHDRDESLGPLRPFRDLAVGLGANGIAVLRYDKRTKHYAARCARLNRFTVVEEVIEDALGAISFLRAHTGNHRLRIVLLGHSLGGTLAPRIAQADGGVAGIVIMAGAARPIATLFVEQIQHLGDISPLVPPTAVARLRREAAAALDPHALATTPDTSSILGLPAAYWKDLNQYSAPETARALRVPLLLLHAGRDYQVTHADLDVWRQALSDIPTATIREYADVNHFFVSGRGPSRPSEYLKPGHVSSDAIADIARWIEELP
jgi:dienelactone hydrolase